MRRTIKDIARENKMDINKNKMSGLPIIKGTRIPVTLILSCLRDNISIEEICEDYKLNKDQVRLSIDFAREIINYFYERGDLK